jgi:photosystem II stability/assembly factor-like uncharacterized protein
MAETTQPETQTQEIVYSLAASPDFEQDGICFAARTSGLYRSDDGGLSWQDAYASLDLKEPLPTAAVAVSPSFGTDRTVFAGVPGGILRSADGGQSWSFAQLTSPPPFVLAMAVSPDFARDGTVLVGTMEDGVFRSGDRGSRWSAWNFGLLDLNVLCLAISSDFATDETLLAGVESGIFRSTNGGRAWREVGSRDNGPLPVDFAPVLSLALSPTYHADGILYAGTESHGLLRSRDRGKTWTRLGETTIADAVNGVLLAPQFPTQPDVLAVLGDRLLISRDAGDTWQDWPSQQESKEVGMTCALAPQGLEPGAPLLVGLADGTVQRI